MKLSSAQRRLLEAVRDGARLVHRDGAWFLTGKTRECKHIRSDTPTFLRGRELIRMDEFTARFVLSQAGRDALERET